VYKNYYKVEFMLKVQFLIKTLYFFIFCIGVSGIAWSKESPQIIEWEMPVDRFVSFGVSPQKLANLIGEGQFVINSKSTDFLSWNARENRTQSYQGKRVAYMVSVIHAPVDKIRDMVWDMGSQDDFSPLLSKAKNLQTLGNKRIASFEQIIKAPIIKLESPFVWQITKEENGDISTVLIDKGDVESTFQYWEFFKLNDNSTLVVLSGWQDTDSASFMYKVMIDSEPALGKVFPLLSLYERIQQFKLEAEKRYSKQNSSVEKNTYNIRTINSFISDRQEVDLGEIKKLNQFGSLQFFQEARTLSHKGRLVDIVQISAIQYVPFPKDKVKPLISGFEGLPEFNEITESYTVPEAEDEGFGHLKIKIKMGPISIPVHIYPKMEEYEKDRYVFYTSEHSYMYPLFGHIEHIDMPEGGTLVELTIGGVIGDKASFKFKMAKYMPFYNVLISATYTMLTADGASPWIKEKLSID